MPALTYRERRSELLTYFDRTAAENWKRLTSDAPVSRIRQTVRAGRDAMRERLLSWLPEDLSGTRLLDAGCGTGVLATVAARRGAEVVAIDLSPTLVKHAAEQLPANLRPGGSGPGQVTFEVGDFLDPSLGQFDYVVAMDSLIHYALDDVAEVLRALAGRTHQGVVFTFAPRTPPLALMHAVGRLLPKGDHRAPAIQPIAERALRESLTRTLAPAGWEAGRTHRVSSGFYTSQAMELKHT